MRRFADALRIFNIGTRISVHCEWAMALTSRGSQMKTPGIKMLRRVVLLLCMAAFGGLAFAQCPQTDAMLPTQPLNYPLPSDQYAVQYRVGSGVWTNANVYISYYGETDGSPSRTNSGFIVGSTSMSHLGESIHVNQTRRLI